MTDGRFRFLVLISLLLMLASVAASAMTPDYSAALATAYDEEVDSLVLSGGTLSTVVVVAILLLMLAGYVGLLWMKAWGRTIALFTTVAGLLVYPFMGPILSSALESMLFDAGNMVWGAVLAIAYFSPVAARFANAPPAAAR